MLPVLLLHGWSLAHSRGDGRPTLVNGSERFGSRPCPLRCARSTLLAARVPVRDSNWLLQETRTASSGPDLLPTHKGGPLLNALVPWWLLVIGFIMGWNILVNMGCWPLKMCISFTCVVPPWTPLSSGVSPLGGTAGSCPPLKTTRFLVQSENKAGLEEE